MKHDSSPRSSGTLTDDLFGTHSPDADGGRKETRSTGTAGEIKEKIETPGKVDLSIEAFAHRQAALLQAGKESAILYWKARGIKWP